MPHVVVNSSSVQRHILQNLRRLEVVRTVLPSDSAKLLKRSPACTAYNSRRPRLAAVALKKSNDEPVASRVLSSILRTSDVPYSSYVPEPRTFLHTISAILKEVWLLALLLLMARASAVMRLSIAAGCALVTIAALPPRLWKAQLRRLGLLALLLFVLTALASDGVPPRMQQRHPPAGLQGLLGTPAPTQGYRYVILNLWFITITRRSISLGIATASLSFVALQSASLCLTCTPAEELAVGVRTLLQPLAVFKAPVNEIGLTLLLSLRFMSLVFEEARNLSLGTAARGINWNNLGPAGGLQILLKLGGRLFSNLMQRSDSIAQAMCARGFVGPQDHKLYLTQTQSCSWTANIMAAICLVLLGVAVKIL